jgi:hypothetical protein
MCHKERRCGYACDPYCSQNRSALGKMEGGFVSRFGSCIDGLSCSELSSQPAFDACWDGAVEDTQPNSGTKRFCEGHAAKVFQCGWVYSQSRCEEVFKIWGGSVRGAIASCEEIEDCAAFDQCVVDVFEAL